MRVCTTTYLNKFVLPKEQGGFEIAPILARMIQASPGISHEELFASIQDKIPALREIESFQEDDIVRILRWMDGKTFDGIQIISFDSREVTCEHQDSPQKDTGKQEKPHASTRRKAKRKTPVQNH